MSRRKNAMSDLNRTFADIAVLEAVLNDARAAGDEESVQNALRLLSGLWRRIAETPQYRRELSGSLSIEEWLRKYRPRCPASALMGPNRLN
jgi:hypothetical protein